MKAVLRSVKPYWLYLIITGKKTVEIGKSCPRAKDWNKVVEMYCSKDMRSFNRIPEEDKKWMRKYLGKVACRFVCDKVDEYTFSHYEAEYRVTHIEQRAMCLNQPELIQYGGGRTLYGWHITDLKIYDKPKELSEFYKVGAKSLEKLATDDELCSYCYRTGGGEYAMVVTPNGLDACEGRFCEEAYEEYLEQEFALTRPPESWMYIQELEERK